MATTYSQPLNGTEVDGAARGLSRSAGEGAGRGNGATGGRTWGSNDSRPTPATVTGKVLNDLVGSIHSVIVQHPNA